MKRKINRARGARSILIAEWQNYSVSRQHTSHQSLGDATRRATSPSLRLFPVSSNCYHVIILIQQAPRTNPFFDFLVNTFFFRFITVSTMQSISEFISSKKIYSHYLYLKTTFARVKTPLIGTALVAAGRWKPRSGAWKGQPGAARGASVSVRSQQ